MLDVLLISPRLPKDDSRYCGDNAYTDLLLQNPPQGVRYHHYEDLISTGQVHRIRFLQDFGHRLKQLGVLPPDLWSEYLVSNFIPDIVHIVSFSAKIVFSERQRLPVVLQVSSPSITDLMIKRHWTSDRIERVYRTARLYLRLLGVYHYALNPREARPVIVQSLYGRDLLATYGKIPRDEIEVLYPAQPTRSTLKTRCKPSEGIRFLFVGSDFERKNGPMVVEAFQKVHAQFPKTQLILVGKPKQDRPIELPGVTHYAFVPHDDLIETIMPQADVLVLPTRAEGSFAFTIFEALSTGLPVITVDAWAMPEIVVDRVNGLLVRSDDLEALQQSMIAIASRSEFAAQLRTGAEHTFRAQFSVEVHNQRLAQLYHRALGELD